MSVARKAPPTVPFFKESSTSPGSASPRPTDQPLAGHWTRTNFTKSLSVAGTAKAARLRVVPGAAGRSKVANEPAGSGRSAGIHAGVGMAEGTGRQPGEMAGGGVVDDGAWWSATAGAGTAVDPVALGTEGGDGVRADERGRAT